MRLDDVNQFNLHKVPPKQVFEWVKTGKWNQQEFLAWWLEICDDCIQQNIDKK